MDAWLFETFEGMRIDGIAGNNEVYMAFGSGSAFSYEMQVPADAEVGEGYDIQPDPAIKSRITLPPYQQHGPVDLEVDVERQFAITVASSQAEGLPPQLSYVLTGDDLPVDIADGVTLENSDTDKLEIRVNDNNRTGTGRYWIGEQNPSESEHFIIGTFATTIRGNQLKGWLNVQGIDVPTSSSDLHSPAIKLAEDITIKGPDGNDQAGDFYYFSRRILENPVSVLWNFGNPVFRFDGGENPALAVGDSFDPATVTVSQDGQQVSLFDAVKAAYDVSAGATLEITNHATPKLELVGDAPPGVTAQGMVAWSAADSALFTFEPGTVLVEWNTDLTTPHGHPVNVTVELTSDWPQPGDANFVSKVLGSGPVLLDTGSTDGFRFDSIRYWSGAAPDQPTISQGSAGPELNVAHPGRTVIRYLTAGADGDPPTGSVSGNPWSVKVVESLTWRDSLKLLSQGPVAADIGRPVPGITFEGQPIDRAALGTGFVLMNDAVGRRAPFATSLHDNVSNLGPEPGLPHGVVIPVNTTVPTGPSGALSETGAGDAWQFIDIQNLDPVRDSGSFEIDSGEVTLSGESGDLIGRSDDFQFFTLSGGKEGAFEIQTKITDLSGNTFAKAGLMLRDRLIPEPEEKDTASIELSKQAMYAVVLDDNHVVTLLRHAADEYRDVVEPEIDLGADFEPPLWLRLRGSPAPPDSGSYLHYTVTAHYSLNGVDWKPAAEPESLTLKPSPYYGLAYTSEDPATPGEAAFADIRVSNGRNVMWTSKGISFDTAIAGSMYETLIDGETVQLNVLGGLREISNDQFTYLFRELRGDDQSVIVRVDEFESSAPSSSLAGLMLRASEDSGSPYVGAFFRKDGTRELWSRTSEGVDATKTSDATVALPAWLRLQRTGNDRNSIFAEYSTDGTTWNPITGEQTSSTITLADGALGDKLLAGVAGDAPSFPTMPGPQITFSHLQAPIGTTAQPDTGPNDQRLVVVYYEEVDGSYWPYQAVEYDPRLPLRPDGIITIAGGLGSQTPFADGTAQEHAVLSPNQYADPVAYNQPDRTLPGYNPNEEHALVTAPNPLPKRNPAFEAMDFPTPESSDSAVFALRDDLNVTPGSSYFQENGARLTSAPYALVSYTDPISGKKNMLSYYVMRDKLPGKDGAADQPIDFEFNGNLAGTPAEPPYPLGDLAAAGPDPDSFLSEVSETDARAFFRDYTGVYWNTAGELSYDGFYFYPMAADFAYPDLGAPDSETFPTGAYVPWLPDDPSAPLPDSRQTPFFLRYQFNNDLSWLPVAVLQKTDWPDDVPGILVGDTLTRPKNGLPGVLNWLAGTVVYDGLNPRGLEFASAEDAQARSSLRIYDALSPVKVTLDPANRLPQSVLEKDVFRKFNQDTQAELTFFKLFSPGISERLGYNPQTGDIILLGLIDGQPVENRNQTSVPADATVLEPNVMSGQELFEILTKLGGPPGDSPWSGISSAIRDAFADKVKELYWESRLNGADPATFAGADNWMVGLEPDGDSEGGWQPADAVGPGLAATTNLAALMPLLEEGESAYDGNYVTLAENNDPVAAGNPVSLQVIKIVPQLANGVVSIQLPEDPLAEKLSFHLNLDFGANSSYVVPDFQLSDNVERLLSFDWIYEAPDPDNPTFPQPPGGTTRSDLAPWRAFDSTAASIHLHSDPAFLLTDWFIYGRYHPESGRAVISDWAGAANSVPQPAEYVPQLATGWVDRVIENINPLETRYRNFTDTNAPEAWSSLIQQAGRPYAGDVALQDNKSFIEGVGLIEFYQTVANRARKLAEAAISAGVTDNQRKNLSQVLLRAGNRISFLYRMLGDEAYSDAVDPLIGAIRFGVDPNFPQADTTPAYEQLGSITLQPSAFAFQNMEDNLLEEELALLMGRSLPGSGPEPSTGAPPVHNRLFWNFTGGQGQMAYLLNYAVDDMDKNGFINAADAGMLYPQGHGDAWGQYLSALEPYYNVLELTEFPWVAGTQPFALDDSVIEVDFWNERSMAEAASARQRAGIAILERVYHQAYREDSPAQWIGYTDTDTERAWGVDGWATRTGLAGVFDWATTNAVLPAAPSPESGTFTVAAGGSATAPIRIDEGGETRTPGGIAGDLTALLNSLNSNAGPGGPVQVSPAPETVPGMSFDVEWGSLGATPLLTADPSGLEPTSRAESERLPAGTDTAVLLNGSGAGVTGLSDQFQFRGTSSKLSGGGSIDAYVSFLENTNSNSQAGLMARAGLEPDAATVLVSVSPGGRVALYSRAAAGESLAQVRSVDIPDGPVWLRLGRETPDSSGASAVAASYSIDGKAWTPVGETASVTLGDSAFYGLAYGSGDDGKQGLAVFDEVTAAPVGGEAVSDWSFTVVGSPATPGAVQTGTRQAQRIRLRQDGRLLSVVDRGAVPDLMEIASQHAYLQSTMDRINEGLNPLGVAPNTVPFDVDPSGIIGAGGFGMESTHFEQIYARALGAWRRAFRVFEHANIQKANLRGVEFDTERLRLGSTSQDFQFRNELIDLLGTPYQGLIGNGKPYPEGYDGPDYYFHNFIDRIDGMAGVNQPSGELVAFFRNFPVTVDHAEGSDVDGPAGDSLRELFGRYFKNDTGGRRDLSIPGETSEKPEFNIQNLPRTAADFGFVAPVSWGQRAAYGKVQLVLQRMVRAEVELDGAVIDYGNLVESIMTTVSLINARAAMNKDLRDLEESMGAAINAMKSLSGILKKAAKNANQLGRTVFVASTVVKEAFPLVAGTSDDATSTLRAGSLSFGLEGLSASISAEGVLETSSLAAGVTASVLEVQKELKKIDIGFAFELAEQLEALEDVLNQEARLRNRVAAQVSVLRESGAEYQAAVQRAIRLWNKRIGWNRKISGAIQKQKTLDMAFRIETNAALRQYREALELARRYTYLAAKAYDYDTALPETDPASVAHVMGEVMRASHLGVMSGDHVETGMPVAGMGGLGGTLDWMKTNYDQFKSQKGLLSPGFNRLSLSLRGQLARISGSNDTLWKKWLQGSHSSSGNGNVAFYYDLGTNPVYRTYCRPYTDSPDQPVPGFVVTFGSSVASGENFFAHPLSGGLSAYDPTRYATRVFSAGVEFKGYDSGKLSSTPRVYLVPTGTDVTRVPGDNQGKLRRFEVVEQRLPVAAMPNETQLTSMEWSPRLDAVNGSFGRIRRYSAFDAFTSPPGDTFDTMALNTDTRLIGRSVWNTEWHLIIPLNSMHHIGAFSATDGSSPDDVADLFREVDDIILHLQTYSLSGN
ncbi:MAG: hypothetical protein ACLFRP_00495 [Puniceicoccaceae bacterium]